jgi:hypothetical protein
VAKKSAGHLAEIQVLLRQNISAPLDLVNGTSGGQLLCLAKVMKLLLYRMSGLSVVISARARPSCNNHKVKVATNHGD